MADTQKINDLINTVWLNEGNFKMSAWLAPPDLEDHELDDLRDGEFVNIECGFALCLAGWQMINDGYKILWSEDSQEFGFYREEDKHYVGDDYMVGEYAAESLGILTPKQTGDNHVFMMTNWPMDNVLQAMKYLAEGDDMTDAIGKAIPSSEQWAEEEERRNAL